MDSISPTALQTLSASPAVTVKTSPIEKDETDLELAILQAIGLGAQELTIIGGVGGRLDHTLGNLYLLAMPQLAQAGIKARILAETEEIFVLRPADSPLVLNGAAGEIVSLFPLNGEAERVYTKNLYYPLNRETLYFGPSRGISNHLTGPQAEVGLESGLLLVIHQFSK
jgi:thiamine pyrophosphokinase